MWFLSESAKSESAKEGNDEMCIKRIFRDRDRVWAQNRRQTINQSVSAQNVLQFFAHKLNEIIE